MAASLPYPSIVFVPLDVLTAEELNQMVQNTAALANLFPLSSANIGNNAVKNANIDTAAVKSTNIDWSTIKPTSANYLDLGTTRIQWGTFTTPTNGTATISLPASFASTAYALVLTAQYNEQENSHWWAYVQNKTSTNFRAQTGFKVNTGTNNGGANSATASFIAIGPKP